MEKEEMISDNDREFLTEHLECPKTPTFYGLPKIHKSFTKFPPLRPIVSNIDSCTRRISEYLDSFLKFQARGCGSFIRDTKHFRGTPTHVSVWVCSSLLHVHEILGKNVSRNLLLLLKVPRRLPVFQPIRFEYSKFEFWRCFWNEPITLRCLRVSARRTDFSISLLTWNVWTAGK